VFDFSVMRKMIVGQFFCKFKGCVPAMGKSIKVQDPHRVDAGGPKHQGVGVSQQPFLELVFVNLWLRHTFKDWASKVGWSCGWRPGMRKPSILMESTDNPVSLQSYFKTALLISDPHAAV
jgi:hypothetical protein